MKYHGNDPSIQAMFAEFAAHSREPEPDGVNPVCFIFKWMAMTGRCHALTRDEAYNRILVTAVSYGVLPGAILAECTQAVGNDDDDGIYVPVPWERFAPWSRFPLAEEVSL